MGTTATDSGGGSWELVPEGAHAARCNQVIDLGTQPGSAQFPNPRHKVLIGWELPEVTREFEGKTVPRLIWSRYTLSLHENATLCKHLEAWRNRKFTPEEKKGFQISKLLGVPCQLQVMHSADGRYSNVMAVTALHPQLRDTLPAAYHGTIHYEIEDGESKVFENFSDNLKATIRQAPEWPGSRDESWGDAPPPHGDDDDIPF